MKNSEQVFNKGDFIKVRHNAGSSRRGEHGIIYGKLKGYTGQWWKVYTTNKYDHCVSLMECDMIKLAGSSQ
jgi:hypothetical protein